MERKGGGRGVGGRGEGRVREREWGRGGVGKRRRNVCISLIFLYYVSGEEDEGCGDDGGDWGWGVCQHVDVVCRLT